MTKRSGWAFRSKLSATLTAAGNIPGNVNGILVNFSNLGTGGFLNGVNVTTDQAPDIIVKAAWDPGWGHYEVFGIQRFFTDNTFCSTGETGCVVGTTESKTSYGTGVGGSVLLPVIPKYLDLTGELPVRQRHRPLRIGSIA